MKALLRLLPVPLLVAACAEGVDGVPVSEIRPDFAVRIAPSVPTEVTARLEARGASFALMGWDRLSASAGGLAQVLAPVPDASEPVYRASFPGLVEGAPATVSLSRTGAASAVESRVTAPAPVTMTRPAEGVTVAVGQALEVAWSQSGTEDRLSVHVVATRCSDGGRGGTAVVDVEGDPGAASVPIGSELLPPGLSAGGSCTADVWVERARSGEVSPDFAPGGRIEARQASLAVPVSVVR